MSNISVLSTDGLVVKEIEWKIFSAFGGEPPFDMNDDDKGKVISQNGIIQNFYGFFPKGQVKNSSLKMWFTCKKIQS